MEHPHTTVAVAVAVVCLFLRIRPAVSVELVVEEMLAKMVCQTLGAEQVPRERAAQLQLGMADPALLLFVILTHNANKYTVTV
jgi:hypothetical protein